MSDDKKPLVHQPDLDKHRNPNGTYDGVGVMAELTRLPRDEIRSLAEQVKANHAKLAGCTYHEFERLITAPPGREVYGCKHCRGTVDEIRYRWHEHGRRPAKVNPEPPAMAITWHDTPESVHRAMWEEGAIANGMTYEQMLDESTTVGEDCEGAEHEVTHEQEMASIRAQGCWAFVDAREYMIHAWAAPGADQALVLHMLAHEIGHVTGAEHPDALQEEMRAEQFGRVAKQAYQLLRQRMPTPKSKQADPGLLLRAKTERCLACGDHHPGMSGLPCPNMRATS